MYVNIHKYNYTGINTLGRLRMAGDFRFTIQCKIKRGCALVKRANDEQQLIGLGDDVTLVVAASQSLIRLPHRRAALKLLISGIWRAV